MRYKLPFLLFVSLAVLLTIGLQLNPKLIPSPLLQKPIPKFSLPLLNRPQQNFHVDELLGEVWVLNVWASWCVACREEHSQLLNLSRQGLIKLVGLDYKDDTQAAMQWLSNQGDPYSLSVADLTGKTAIDLGVYGVPETYIIDKHGVVRYKHTGPLLQHDLDSQFLALIYQLLAEAE